MVKDMKNLSRGEKAQYVIECQNAKRLVLADNEKQARIIREAQTKIDANNQRLEDIDRSIHYLT